MDKRVALITGAGRGIGAKIALTLAKENTDIAVVDYSDESAAKETLEALAQAGVTARYYKCDVSDFNAVKTVVDQIVKDFGKIDILVNNAGITADKLILRMEESDWDRVLDINLKGCFNMITPRMINTVPRISSGHPISVLLFILICLLFFRYFCCVFSKCTTKSEYENRIRKNPRS